MSAKTNGGNAGFALTHEDIAGMTEEELIRQTRKMQQDYERKNKPRPEEVKGIPTWLDIHGEKRYCLHYPSKGRKNGPVFFDIHGGGFVWGYPEEDDRFCARMNEVLDVEIYSLEYPRTAEHRFPEAFEELYDTIQYMTAHAEEYNFDPEQAAVGGHSAGGNLTAAIALKNNKEKDFHIKCQVLAYPGVSLEDASLKNIEENPLGLTSELMELFAKAYAAEEDRKRGVSGAPDGGGPGLPDPGIPVFYGHLTKPGQRKCAGGIKILKREGKIDTIEIGRT